MFLFRKKDKANPCKAKLIEETVDGIVTYTEKGPPHNHIIDIRDVEVKQRMKAAKESARTTGKRQNSR